jgi:hypothetical protein
MGPKDTRVTMGLKGFKAGKVLLGLDSRDSRVYRDSRMK